MEPAVAASAASDVVTFSDGLGERRSAVAGPGENDAVDILSLRSELTEVPAFEFALRERAGRLSGFRHAYFGRVRSVDRLSDAKSTLAVISDRTPGIRLSDLLNATESHRLTLDINAALCLVRQLVPAVALLHEHAPEVAHGAIGPERVIVGPNGRLVIVEHVLGAALEQLRYSHERYWKELRIALPRSASLPRFDQRADVMQMGVVALSLILGRVLRDDEYPAKIGDAVSSAWAISARGGLEPLPAGLRAWLGRALQVDLRNSFATAKDASIELDKVLGDSDYMAAPAAVEAFLTQYHAAVDPPPVAAAVAAAPKAAPAPKPAPEAAAPAAPVDNVAAVSKPAPVAPKPVVAAPAAPAATATRAIAPTPVSKPAPAFIEPIEPDDDVESDSDEDHSMTQHRKPAQRSGVAAVAAGVLMILAVGGFFAARRYGTAFAAPPPTGTLSITTNPAGAEVVVDGEAHGVTPVNLTLKTGEHQVVLKGAGDPRTLPITITAGAQVSQFIDMPKAGAATGQLQVRTEPAGAQVSVDGVPRGPSPAMVADLAPGSHSVAVESPLGTVKQTVTVEAGTTASVVVPLAPIESAPVSGWVSVSAPVDVQLYENKKLLGSSQSDRIMVSAGRHEIEVVNEILGYRAMRTVQVPAGKVASIKIHFPKGTIALNAIPWAEVWIDGEKVGETPIGNLAVTIGPHEVVFRNPDLGEQKNAVTVTLNAPARLSVDLRKK
jgi:hypothetical protein